MEKRANDITVEKLDPSGRVVVSYRGVALERFPRGIQLEARWERPALDLGYTRFMPGDRFVEWFYTDRWYNIFEIHASGTDALRGWYCNIAAPASIEGRTIRSRDLLLDLWVGPDGTMLPLDEDEFAADTTMDDALRTGAEGAMAMLRALVEQRTPPFDRIDRGPPSGA